MTFTTRIQIWLVNKQCDHMNYVIISSWMAFITTNQIMGVIIFIMFWCNEPSFETLWVNYFHFVSLWTLRKYIFRDSSWIDKLLHISKLGKVLWKYVLQALVIHMGKLQAIKCALGQLFLCLWPHAFSLRLFIWNYASWKHPIFSLDWFRVKCVWNLGP
jgi:hypothetical protein